MPEAPVVAAIGLSITANVDGDRQVVFQTHIPNDMADAEVNRLLDRLMGFAARQKLVHDIKGMKKEIEQLMLDTDRYAIQQTETRKACQIANAQLNVQIMEWTAQAKEKHDKAYAEHNASGRRGDFAPRGLDASAIGSLNQMIADAKAQKASNEEGLEAELVNIATNIERRDRRIEQLKADIAEAELKVG